MPAWHAHASAQASLPGEAGRRLMSLRAFPADPLHLQALASPRGLVPAVMSRHASEGLREAGDARSSVTTIGSRGRANVDLNFVGTAPPTATCTRTNTCSTKSGACSCLARPWPQLVCPGWMQLASPCLSRLDEQVLSESTFRFQMADPHVLAETWYVLTGTAPNILDTTNSQICRLCSTHLGGALCHNLPAAAIIDYSDLYVGLVSLLTTTESAQPQHSPLALTALDTATQVVDQLLGGLIDAADAPRRHSDSHPLEPNELACSHDRRCCRRGSGAWHMADAIWAATTPQLRHVYAAPAATALLMRVLPLLYVPPAAASVGSAHKSARKYGIELWRDYLEALVSVLRFHRLIPWAELPNASDDRTCPSSHLTWLAELEPSHLPLLLITLAASAACPSTLSVAASVPGLDALLTHCVADPHLPVMEPAAHLAARATLAQIDAAAGHAAAAAVLVEAAAHAAASLSLPTKGQRAECQAFNPSERNKQLCAACATLGECLPALSYTILPALPVTVIELARCCRYCGGSGQAGAASTNAALGVAAVADALLCFLLHPVAFVRELTLKHMLTIFSLERTGVSGREYMEGIDHLRETPEGSEELQSTVAIFSLPKLLRVLVDASLQLVDEPGDAASLGTPTDHDASAASIERLAKLSHALLLSLLPAMSNEQMRAACLPLTPLLQAHLMPVATFEAVAREKVAVERTSYLARRRAESAAVHAQALLSIIHERSEQHTRMAVLMRLMLRRDVHVAARASATLCACFILPGAPRGLPRAPLHGLSPGAQSSGSGVGGGANVANSPAITVNLVDVQNLLLILPAPSLQMRVRLVAAEHFAHLGRRRYLHMKLAASTTSAASPPPALTFLSSLLVVVDDSLAEGAAAAPMATALMELLSVLLDGSHSARASTLASIPALDLFARCTVHPLPTVRATIRTLLHGILFDEHASAAAAAAKDGTRLPHLTQPAKLPRDASRSPLECATAPSAKIIAAFDLQAIFPDRNEPASRDATLAGLAPAESVSRSLALRNAFRAVVCVEVDTAVVTAPAGGGSTAEQLPLTPREAAAATALARRLTPAASLVALDTATAHHECSEAIRALHYACATQELREYFVSERSMSAVDDWALMPPTPAVRTILGALSAHPPCQATHRLLSVAPVTVEDDSLLATLLDVLVRAMAPRCTPQSRHDTSGGAKQPPPLLVEQLTVVASGVLDRTPDPCDKPLPRAALRAAALRYGVALLEAYPAVAVQLLGSGRLLPLLADQYAVAGIPFLGMGGANVLPLPPPIRRLALDVLHAAISKCSGRTKQPASTTSRVASLLPSLICATSAEQERSELKNSSAARLATHAAPPPPSPPSLLAARGGSNGCGRMAPMGAQADNSRRRAHSRCRLLGFSRPSRRAVRKPMSSASCPTRSPLLSWPRPTPTGDPRRAPPPSITSSSSPQPRRRSKRLWLSKRPATTRRPAMQPAGSPALMASARAPATATVPHQVFRRGAWTCRGCGSYFLSSVCHGD